MSATGTESHLLPSAGAGASGIGFPEKPDGTFQRCLRCGTDEARGSYCTWCRTAEYELVDHRHGSGRDSCPLGTYRNPGRATSGPAIEAALVYNRTNPPDLSSPYVADRRRHPARLRLSRAGQALVEFALMLPLVLWIGLAFIEAGLLVAEKADQDRRLAFVADWAAANPDQDWRPLADDRLPGCAVELADHPDDAADVLTLAATCQYAPIATAGLWAGLPISSEASAVVAPEPTPTPTPTPEPTGTVAP